MLLRRESVDSALMVAAMIMQALSESKWVNNGDNDHANEKT